MELTNTKPDVANRTAQIENQKGLSDVVLIKIVESIKEIIVKLIEQKCQPITYRE